MPLGAVVSFYSPCNYELPKRHLATTLQWLLDSGVQVALTQAIFSGQEPQPAPQEVRSRVYEGAEPIFYKENLWNLGARLLPECDKLLFLDCDIRLSEGWVGHVSGVLDSVDVCSPFQRARWLDRNGTIFQQMLSAGAAIAKGAAPWPHRAHPGFGVAMTRNAFERLGGIYDRAIAGGGDAAFWFALSDHAEMASILRTKAQRGEMNVGVKSFNSYRANALKQRLRVGFVPGDSATHLWHGERENRQYLRRELYFPKLPNGEPPVEYREDGLLRYTAAAPAAMEYFILRKEDG